jgi:hypothetical protein
MTEIRFHLDEDIYSDIIAEMKAMAGPKKLGKIMPRILTEWYLGRNGEKAVVNETETRQNEDENSLANELSSLSFE